jgi:hypothetical protein
MKILIQSRQYVSIYAPLAREIGLEESVVLLGIEAGIQEHGTTYKAHRAICWSSDQLKERFGSLMSIREIKIALDSLQKKDLLFVSDGQDSKCFWLALNWPKVRELKSILVMSEEESAELAPLPTVKAQKATGNGNGGSSLLETAVWHALVKSAAFNPKGLTPRDVGELKEARKRIIAMAADMSTGYEIYPLVLRILGQRVWWVEILGAKSNPPHQPLRPMAAISKWVPYVEYCQRYLRGTAPQIPNEWLRDFERFRHDPRETEVSSDSSSAISQSATG